MSSFYDQLNKELANIKDDLDQLFTTQYSLNCVGLTVPANDIMDAAKSISFARSNIKQLISDKISADFQDSRKGIGELLSACAKV